MPIGNFGPSSLATIAGQMGIPFDEIADKQTLSANGPITLLSGVVVITKTSAAALTIQPPDMDGQSLTVISETAFAHTITAQGGSLFNNQTGYNVITMSSIIGDSVVLNSEDGIWWVTKPHFNANIYTNVLVLSGDGAISIKNGVVALTKGSAAAITIATPTAGVDDGAYLEIYTETAFAHVVTQGTDGFNAKGASGTATFTAAKGNAFSIVARNGHWWTTSTLGVTIA